MVIVMTICYQLSVIIVISYRNSPSVGNWGSSPCLNKSWTRINRALSSGRTILKWLFTCSTPISPCWQSSRILGWISWLSHSFQHGLGNSFEKPWSDFIRSHYDKGLGEILGTSLLHKNKHVLWSQSLEKKSVLTVMLLFEVLLLQLMKGRPISPPYFSF